MKMLVQLTVSLLLISSSFGGPLSRLETAQPRENDIDYRLPRHITPIRYELRLTPDIDNAKFSGSVKIQFKVSEASNSITLHNRKLNIFEQSIKVTDDTSSEIEVQNTESGAEESQEFYIIYLKKDLTANKEYTLEISKFLGTLNDENQGFYLAEFKDEDGNPKKFATTQFEPTAARRAFPCFDEPALKATFKIFLTRPNSTFISVANNPLVKSVPVPDSNAIEDEFEETVEMSTYLVAFVVSQMKLSTKGTHGVLARPQAIEEKTEQYALDTGIEILNAIAEFVGVDYTLPKMDQAAIPDKYFSAGAMENWGLVTYRETYLLKSDKSTTSSMHQSITTIIAHEYGHQWFGNLVSPKWWEFLWLNEGFATYFEHFAASVVAPAMRIMDQFVVKNTQYAFGPDGLNTTRSMNHAAGSPTEISALFDRIAYEKSGSVIRMMEAFLTTSVFKKGLNYYLTEMRKNSATPSDLYEQLQKAVTESNTISLPQPVAQIMATWDGQKGYPVVDVIRNYDATEQEKVFFNQSRFLIKNQTSEDEPVWSIPINAATKTNPTFESTNAEAWLTKKEDNITIGGLLSEDWLIINKQETGYYRVNYDERNWKLISDALAADFSNVHLLNRAQLIDDSFNLARAGRLSYNIPFELSSYLSKETDYIPFYSFFTASTFLNNMLPGSAAHSYFKVHVSTVLDSVHTYLGYEEKEDDMHLDKLNRISVYNWLCNTGDSECRSTALTQFRNWKSNASLPVPLNLQAPVYCGAMRTGDQEDWDFLYSKYTEVVDSEDNALRTRILNALGCSENTDILEFFLGNSTTDGSIIRPEDAFAVVYNSGSVGVTLAFEYISTNFIELYGKLNSRVATILNGIGSKLTTNEQLTKLQELAQENENQKELFISAIANAQENVNWNEVYLSDISVWLSKYKSSGNIRYIFSSSSVFLLSYLLHKLS